MKTEWTTPPEGWQTIPTEKQSSIDIYNSLTRSFKDDDIIFKIIDEDGDYEYLLKKNIEALTLSLSKKILNQTKNSCSGGQLKIFAILSASKNSSLLILSALRIKAHFCICFD